MAGSWSGVNDLAQPFAQIVAPGGEVGDMCEYRQDQVYTPPDVGFEPRSLPLGLFFRVAAKSRQPNQR